MLFRQRRGRRPLLFTLYDSPGCDDPLHSRYFCRDQLVNLDEVGIDNDVSSYRTDCYKITA